MSSRENLTPVVLTSVGVVLSLFVGVLARRRGGWLRRPAGSRRRPGFWVVALGGWLLAAACFAGAATDWRFDWYHYRPARSLLRDVVADDPLGGRRAWRELSRRRKSGTLPEWAEQELADDALAEQANPSASQGRFHPELINYVADRFLAGELDQARSARFFARAVTLDFRARPAVRCGDEAPAVVTAESTLPRHGGWSYEAVSTDVWLDDVRLPGEGLRD